MQPVLTPMYLMRKTHPLLKTLTVVLLGSHLIVRMNFPTRHPWDNLKPIRGSCTTCWGMSGNGLRIATLTAMRTTPTDGSAQESPDNSACPLRVLRGGSWSDGPRIVRSADRSWNTPDYRINNIGFRLARTL